MRALPTYPRTKPTTIPWIGEVPEHWEVRRLGSLGTFFKGSGIARADITETGLPAITYGDIYTRYSVEAKALLKFTSPEVAMNAQEIMKGDLLFTASGETLEDIGKTTLYSGDVPGYAGGDIVILRQDQGDSLFLSYALNSDIGVYQKSLFGRGDIIVHISASNLKQLVVPFPPLPEQTHIARYLSYKTALIDAYLVRKRRMMALLKEQRQALISQAVTKGLDPNAPMKDSGVEWIGEVPEHWEVKKLKHIGRAITGLTYSPNDVVGGPEEGILVLRSSNIQQGRPAFEDNVFVSMAVPDELVTRSGDILLCSRNGSRALIGKNILIDDAIAGSTFGAFMTVFRSKYSDYLYYYFNSEVFNASSSLFLSSTVNQLTLGVLNEMTIALPVDDTERKQITNYLRQQTSLIDEELSRIEASMERVREYRQALISAVVTGKVDVRGVEVPEEDEIIGRSDDQMMEEDAELALDGTGQGTDVDGKDEL